MTTAIRNKTQPRRSARSLASEATFWKRVDELGARRTKNSIYAGTDTPVELRCHKGHACRPRPIGVLRQEKGICIICAGKDPVTAEAAFWKRVASQKGRRTKNSIYAGANTPVELRCYKGHACRPRPADVQQGHGICAACAGRDPVVAEAAFWKRVASQKGRRTKNSIYVNCDTPVELRCHKGHTCNPTPSSVRGGHGICGQCHVTYDRVYLLVHLATRAIKIGIASGESRVLKHVERGYQPVEQWLGLGHDRAKEVENSVLASWKAAGWGLVANAPKNGRTETTDLVHLKDTRKLVRSHLGSPS
jgi:hypothetical protein